MLVLLLFVARKRNGHCPHPVSRTGDIRCSMYRQTLSSYILPDRDTNASSGFRSSLSSGGSQPLRLPPILRT
jgi:hypothetical protein